MVFKKRKENKMFTALLLVINIATSFLGAAGTRKKNDDDSDPNIPCS